MCQGSAYRIDCQGDQKLEIVSADFGRWARGVCKGFWDIDWNTNCHTAAALEITKNECEGLSSCVLHASVSEYGEPCFLIKKYLVVCANRLLLLLLLLFFFIMNITMPARSQSVTPRNARLKACILYCHALRASTVQMDKIDQSVGVENGFFRSF